MDTLLLLKKKQWNKKCEKCQFCNRKMSKEGFFGKNQSCVEKCLKNPFHVLLNACHQIKFWQNLIRFCQFFVLLYFWAPKCSIPLKFKTVTFNLSWVPVIRCILEKKLINRFRKKKVLVLGPKMTRLSHLGIIRISLKYPNRPYFPFVNTLIH